MTSKGTDRGTGSFQLCLYDDRLGLREGEEAEKILAFYPSETSLNEQTAIVGLVQAMSTFTSVFSKASFPQRIEFATFS